MRMELHAAARRCAVRCDESADTSADAAVSCCSSAGSDSDSRFPNREAGAVLSYRANELAEPLPKRGGNQSSYGRSDVLWEAVPRCDEHWEAGVWRRGMAKQKTKTGSGIIGVVVASFMADMYLRRFYVMTAIRVRI